MPRVRRRIPLASNSPAASLAVTVEWELAFWRGLHIPGLGLATREEFAAAWEAYREIIAPAWIAAMPGSRPFGAYVAGELPPPPVIQTPRVHDGRRTIGGFIWYEAAAYGARDHGELEHLVAIGEVDAVEAQAARRRLDQAGSAERYPWQHGDANSSESLLQRHSVN